MCEIQTASRSSHYCKRRIIIQNEAENNFSGSNDTSKLEGKIKAIVIVKDRDV